MARIWARATIVTSVVTMNFWMACSDEWRRLMCIGTKNTLPTQLQEFIDWKFVFGSTHFDFSCLRDPQMIPGTSPNLQHPLDHPYIDHISTIDRPYIGHQRIKAWLCWRTALDCNCFKPKNKHLYEKCFFGIWCAPNVCLMCIGNQRKTKKP